MFLVVFNNFFTKPVGNENVRLRLALTIPAGVPITVANDAIEMLPPVADQRFVKIINRSNIVAKSFTH